MGAVYEAIDRNLAETPCAIKEVLPSALQGPDAEYVLRSFASEMKALANLNHPNIPRVRDFFEDDGKRYIVMDLVQGQGLDDELAEHLRVTGEAMDPAVAALDMVQVLETLHYLHTGQPALVHRDIKPANLIRDQRSGKIRLVDFGIARSVETQRMQTQVGTPGFCAPEQMAGRAEPRSDVFSVGATLCFLVTGKQGPFYAYQALKPDLPQHPGLAEIIEKATEVRVQDRFASAQDMAEALKTWLRSQSSGSTPAVASPRPVPEQQAVAMPTRPAPATLQAESNPKMMAALIGLLLLVSLGLFVSTPTPEQPHSPPTPTPTKVVASTSASPTAMPTRVPLAAEPPRPRPNPARPTPARPKPIASPKAPKPVTKPSLSRPPRLEPEELYPVKLPEPRKPGGATSKPLVSHVPPGPPRPTAMPVFPSEDLGFVRRGNAPRGGLRFERISGDTVLTMNVQWTDPSQSAEELADRYPKQHFRSWMRSPWEKPGEICRYTNRDSQHWGIHFKQGIIFNLYSAHLAPGYEWEPVLQFIEKTHW